MNNSIEIENCLNQLSDKFLQEKGLFHRINNFIIANFFESIAEINIKPSKFSYSDKDLIRITSSGIRATNGIPHTHFYKTPEEALKAYKSTLFLYFKNELNSETKYALDWIVLPRVRKYEISYLAYSVFKLKLI